MPYRNLPRGRAPKKENLGAFKQLCRFLNCTMGNHEYNFTHEPMDRPHWVTDTVGGYKFDVSWLTKTVHGMEYYQAGTLCPHCQTVFKAKNESIRVLNTRLNLGQRNDMVEAWEKYVDRHLLGSKNVSNLT